jgi:hypothetical protein
VAQAESALKSDQLGVRDEVGFLSLHQALSDRFFPGTSVLHTRLRYALFVPWLMEEAQGNPVLLRKHELALTRQLNQGADKSKGVIGGSIYPEAPVQPPSMIYWSALARWHILQPRPDGLSSSRGEILKKISAIHSKTPSRQRMDDADPAEDDDLSPFVKLPSPPAEFLSSSEPMDFNLTTPERNFMRRHLIGVGRGASPQNSQSLLSRMAEERLSVRNINVPWSKAIRDIADADDKRALIVASHVAALAGIGRAVYAALVEEAKAADGAPRTTVPFDDTQRMVATHGEAAKALDISALNALVPGLPSYLIDVLNATQKWLQSSLQKVDGLRDVYQRAEQRKGARARLASNLGGQGRRAEWSAEQHPLAEPLHFRWGNVRRLLNDLEPA